MATNIDFSQTSLFLTNATLLFSNFTIYGIGTCVQDGGFLSGTNFNAVGGSFELDGGELSALSVDSGDLNQNGGEIDCSFFGAGGYSLSNGVLNTFNFSGYLGSVTQTGGSITVSNNIFVAGMLEDYGPNFFGLYTLEGGFLSSGAISLGNVGDFEQYGGTNRVNGNIELNPENGYSAYSLSNGLLTDSNTIVTMVDSGYSTGSFFSQVDGVHWITNSLMISSEGYNSGSYSLAGGTLVAPNILITGGGTLRIGASPGAVISNQTSFVLDGYLVHSNSILSLAPLLVSGDQSEIEFGGSNQLRFAKSSAQVWTNGLNLAIYGWNGSPSGGGATQLSFGADTNGLTPAQLQQIFFVNPSGFAGRWPAKILATGEIVPDTEIPMSISVIGQDVVVQWSNNNFSLTVATNVAGPYENLNRASPYTNDATQSPQLFFRLTPFSF